MRMKFLSCLIITLCANHFFALKIFTSKPTGSPSIAQVNIFSPLNPADNGDYLNYLFNHTNVTINATGSLSPTSSPTMRFYSQVNETFNQHYQGTDLIAMNRKQVKRYEVFMASLTTLYALSDEGIKTETSCDVVQQSFSDVFRRLLLKVEKDDQMNSRSQRLLQEADDGQETPRSQLNVVFDVHWKSIDQYLNDTEYIANFVEFMNSDMGRNLTLLALKSLNVTVDTIDTFRVWVDPDESEVDIEISTSDVPTWDVLRTTAIFTLVTTIFFLIVFELGRRHRVLKLVFDRRRAAQPHRTPAPLKTRCFEWLLFLSANRYLCNIEPLSEEHKKVVSPMDSSLNSDDDGVDNCYGQVLSPLQSSPDTSVREHKEEVHDERKEFNEFHSNRKTIFKNQRTCDLQDSEISTIPRLATKLLSISEFEETPQEMLEVKNNIHQSRKNDEGICADSADMNSNTYLLNYKRKRQKTARSQSFLRSASKIKKEIPHMLRASVEIKELDLEYHTLIQFIGLDAFVMLRFIKYGFHVTFYPFILACILLIPIYHTNDYESKTGNSHIFATGYFSLTLNRLENGSPRFWMVWIYAILYRIFTWYRLWKEWELFLPFRFEFLMNGDSEHKLKLMTPQILSSDSSADSRQTMVLPLTFDKKEGYDDLTHSLTARGTRENALPVQTSSKEHIELEVHNADVAVVKEVSLLSLDEREKYLKHNQVKQFRNTCFVENIPQKYRTNKKLFSFFDELFPDQVERVQIFVQNNKLDEAIEKRQKSIEDYEKLFAIHHYEQRRFLDNPNRLKEPKELTIKLSNGCTLIKHKYEVEALPYYLKQIEDLNDLANNEFMKIMLEEKVDDGRVQTADSQRSRAGFNGFTSSAYDTTKSLFAKRRKYASGTAVVQFKTLAAARNATQCSITGKLNHFTITNAPDPREIIWSNATVNQKSITFRKMIATAFLILGTFIWSPIVAFITSFTNVDNLKSFLPDWIIPPPGTPFYNFVRGYVPVLVLEVLMTYVPVFISTIATRFIRLKTLHEIDYFVLFWNSVYRTVNIFIVIVSGSFLEFFNAAISEPQLLFNLITQGIFFSSQFFFDNVIFATGTGLFWELCQLPSVISYFVTRKLKEEATCSRQLEKLEETPRFDWGDCLPEFLFIFMVAQLFSAIVPVILGVCAIFFFLAYKIFLHQAFYIYSSHETGGSFMYHLSNASFLMMQISNFIFFGIFALKNAGTQGLSYLIITFIGTILVKKKINSKFILPSIRISLAHARINDEKNKELEKYWRRKDLRLKKKISRMKNNDSSPKRRMIFLDYDYITQNSLYMYLQPQLNKLAWETKPRPYSIATDTQWRDDNHARDRK